jgi:uncharacterized protein
METLISDHFGTERIFSQRDGELLIGSARESIDLYFQTGNITIPNRMHEDARFEKKLGCFVTLKNDDPERSLRGCIGFPEPVAQLKKALSESAVAAATQDPRFPPVIKSELKTLLLEVSVLTKPALISVQNKRDLPNHVRIGVDGLIMRWEFGSGLLLPQVATEYRWEAEEFLCNLSMKAGAEPDRWLLPGSIIYKFQAQVFEESSPFGNVVLLEKT